MRIKRKDIFWLILLRLIIVTSLVVAVVIIQYNTSAFFPALFYYAILFVYFLSAVYFVLYFTGKHETFQVCLQIFFDLLLITAFVYFSGGLRGSFYFLYIFEIIAASVVLSNRAAYLTAALSGVYFGVLVNGLHFEFIPYIGPEKPVELSPGLVINNIFISWSVFFLVAFLVNYVTGGLRRTAEKLRLAERELDIKKRLALAGEFSAHLAHEIRNPLAVISGSVQVLKNELEVKGEQKDLMQNIIDQSAKVSQSIQQFLSLASPGKHTFTDIHLSSLVDEIFCYLEESGEWDGKYKVGGNYKSSQVSYFGNTNQFKQMFWNLIRNAVRSMPQGGTLTIDIYQPKKDEIQIVFSDTGNGMREEDQKRLFEPDGREFQEGKGIGMAVVRRIVDDYNGKIRVHSVRDKGTQMTISLPAFHVGNGSRAKRA